MRRPVITPDDHDALTEAAYAGVTSRGYDTARAVAALTPVVTRIARRAAARARTRQAIHLTPRQAAALYRLLDAYVANEDDQDPGLPDLAVLHSRVGRLDLDHSAYDASRPTGARP